MYHINLNKIHFRFNDLLLMIPFGSSDINYLHDLKETVVGNVDLSALKFIHIWDCANSDVTNLEPNQGVKKIYSLLGINSSKKSYLISLYVLIE